MQQNVDGSVHTNFLDDKRLQLLAVLGVPVLFAFGNALLNVIADQSLIIISPSVTAMVVTITTLLVRELASYREGKAFKNDLVAPPSGASAPITLATDGGVEALIKRYQTDRELLIRIQTALAQPLS